MKNNPLPGKIVECKLGKNNEWLWCRFRYDKVSANYIGVVHSVIRSIKNAVNTEELLALQNDIHKAWKRRENTKAT